MSLADKALQQDPQPPQDPTEGADLLPVPGAPYYTTQDLTVRPQPLEEGVLDPPEIAPIVASGKIILTLWINELGEVADVLVENTELSEAITKTAVAAFQKMRFTPGEVKGRKVGTIMRIEVSYDDSRIPPK